MLSLCLTSYSLGKDLPETNGGSFLLSIILALKNKINWNIQKTIFKWKQWMEHSLSCLVVLTFRTASFFFPAIYAVTLRPLVAEKWLQPEYRRHTLLYFTLLMTRFIWETVQGKRQFAEGGWQESHCWGTWEHGHLSGTVLAQGELQLKGILTFSQMQGKTHHRKLSFNFVWY